MSWALVGLWLLVREPLLALLPRGRRGRPAVLLRCGAARARASVVTGVWWYLSAVLGALTHVVWDAFTHQGRWGTRLVPAIGRDRVAGVPLFSLLQYGSSVTGAVVIAVFAVRVLRRTPGGAPVGVPVLSVRDRWWAGAVIGGCAVAGAVQRAARWWALVGAPERPWDLVPAVCFGVGAGPVLGLVLYAVGVRVWRRGPAPGGSADPADPADPGGVVGAGRGRPAAR